MNDAANDALCPCGSNLPYSRCCGQYHGGTAHAPTAEALMRSRYSAFARRDADYLLRTLHASRRAPGELDSIRRSFAETVWTGLTIVDTRQGTADDESGYVEFVARYEAGGHAGNLHERSRFVREQGEWFYIDGEMAPTRSPGRNDPCWCGSGKKFKKCHG